MSAVVAEAGFRLACDADFSLAASFPPDDDDAITRLDGGNEAAPVTSTIVNAIFEARGIALCLLNATLGRILLVLLVSKLQAQTLPLVLR